MEQKTRIVAAVVDQRNLTLYKQDGTTILIPQGDPRLRRILQEAIPQIEAQKWADVVIDIKEDNSYQQFEEKGSGLVRFFKVAKEKLLKLFGADEPVAEVAVGVIPVAPAATVPSLDDQEETFEPVIPMTSAKVEHTQAIVDEIIAHAIPVSSTQFDEKTVVAQRDIQVKGKTSSDHPNEDSPDTIIAVVGGKVIPNVELIKSHFTRAAKLGSTIGVENFLKRLASVIEHRRHSVEDLLRFLERADLPIADDGSILIYKVLRSHGDRTDGKYVDCHTGKVTQWTGAYVCMDPSLVDHNRSTECSNGLHVARRGYISQFSGDVCVLAKLDPEDVITVPTYDANKMRVCGYHILMELSPQQHSLLRQNRPLTEDAEGKSLLALAMMGKHIHRTHEVRITKGSGEGLVITALKKPVTMADVPAELISGAAEAIEQFGEDELERFADEQKATPQAEALPDAPNAPVIDAPVDPVKVVKQVEQLSRKEQAKRLYNDWLTAESSDDQAKSDAALAALLAFKKAAKTGWDKLGIPDPTRLEKPVVKAKAKPAAKKAKAKPAKTTRPVALPPVAAVTPAKTESPRSRIQKMLDQSVLSQADAILILKIKKDAKKSWEYLGVNDGMVADLVKLAK